MGRECAFVPLLLLGLVGCIGPQPSSDQGNWLERLRSAQGALATEGVLMDIVLLERPLGDPYFNKELWSSVNQQIGELETRARLEDNGFRFGRLLGQPPASLHALLTSERYAVGRLRQWLPSGGTHAIPLGAPQSKCDFQVFHEGQPISVSFDQGQCHLLVTPTLTSDGRTQLRFVPQVQHGETTREFEVPPERTGLQMQYRRPRRDFAELAWDVTLAPNEFFLIGGLYDEPQSLGYQAFMREDPPTPVQRLLVIRTSRSLDTASGAQPSTGAPLALQAIGK